jgi:hypothetical protein
MYAGAYVQMTSEVASSRRSVANASGSGSYPLRLSAEPGFLASDGANIVITSGNDIDWAAYDSPGHRGRPMPR